MQRTLQVVSRGALSNFIHPTCTPTPHFPVRIFLPEEMWQSGPLDRYDPALYLVCLSKEASDQHVRAARMCDHETPRVNCINPYFSAQQRRKRSSHENTSARTCVDRHCSQRTGSIVQSYRQWRRCLAAMRQTFVNT